MQTTEKIAALFTHSLTNIQSIPWRDDLYLAEYNGQPVLVLVTNNSPEGAKTANIIQLQGVDSLLDLPAKFPQLLEWKQLEGNTVFLFSNPIDQFLGEILTSRSLSPAEADQVANWIAFLEQQTLAETPVDIDRNRTNVDWQLAYYQALAKYGFSALLKTLGDTENKNLMRIQRLLINAAVKALTTDPGLSSHLGTFGGGDLGFSAEGLLVFVSLEKLSSKYVAWYELASCVEKWTTRYGDNGLDSAKQVLSKVYAQLTEQKKAHFRRFFPAILSQRVVLGLSDVIGQPRLDGYPVNYETVANGVEELMKLVQEVVGVTQP